jgi:hypothetical protein
MHPLIAHCHNGLGKVHLHTGKRERPQDHAATAATMYGDMGMTSWLEQAEAEMRQLQYWSRTFARTKTSQRPVVPLVYAQRAGQKEVGCPFWMCAVQRGAFQ